MSHPQASSDPLPKLRQALEVFAQGDLGRGTNHLFALNAGEQGKVFDLVVAAVVDLQQPGAERRLSLTQVMPSYRPQPVAGMDVELRDIDRTNEELLGGEFAEAIAMLGVLEAQRA